MKKLIKFNAWFSYQYYDEDGKLISADDLVEILAKQAGVEIIEEGNGEEFSRKVSITA